MLKAFIDGCMIFGDIFPQDDGHYYPNNNLVILKNSETGKISIASNTSKYWNIKDIDEFFKKEFKENTECWETQTCNKILSAIYNPDRTSIILKTDTFEKEYLFDKCDDEYAEIILGSTV